jgi:hypothetical protein
MLGSALVFGGAGSRSHRCTDEKSRRNRDLLNRLRREICPKFVLRQRALGSLSDLLPDRWEKSPHPPTELAGLMADANTEKHRWHKHENALDVIGKKLNILKMAFREITLPDVDFHSGLGLSHPADCPS